MCPKQEMDIIHKRSVSKKDFQGISIKTRSLPAQGSRLYLLDDGGIADKCRLLEASPFADRFVFSHINSCLSSLTNLTVTPQMTLQAVTCCSIESSNDCDLQAVMPVTVDVSNWEQGLLGQCRQQITANISTV